ncbi:MAG: diaminopimelate decarboxylase [Calditrichaeota bacterium]|nr:MAG: diaminopimelate decarboxylase [Calditrichota bacterium]MBL1207607.1 diaminopimelate decarboxylase [Calditrichota bacterium]NOG47440.1 diaminopimelate decarboxylase [Calditrichota bacterium]
MKPPFYYKTNRLFCENLDIETFAQTVPTPFYLYSKSEIGYNCQSVWDAANIVEGIDLLPCYALKANYNPAILKLVQANGFGADIVSGGELYFAQKAGFPIEKTVFAGVGKTETEIREALQKNVHSINIESEEELHLVARLATEEKKIQRIAIRINPDIDAKTHAYISTGLHTNKFGVSTEQALSMYQEAQKYKSLNAEGIHVHIGSQIDKDGPYKATAEKLKSFISKLASKNISIKYIDLGGGIGINYENTLSEPGEPRTYINEILPKYLSAFKGFKLKLFVELGRSIIGSAGILVSKVLIRKKTPLKNFIIVDAAMNNLMRPSLYEASHQIAPLKKENYETIVADIVGPVCESGDFLAKEIYIEDIPSGEMIAVASTGAYGQVLSSNYNLRPTIPEYLVDGDKVQCIFKGTTVNDIANNYNW